ncbi:MAG TPA: hypothetical protein DEG06_05460 [Lachnospiraceae bacterium]|jgi:hypothetical protein|nr:hypothetical protein [Lachnospiraceae bacterium]HCR39466.1 hypothetical protein [Lachnospiraceae bacterium]
MNKYIIFGPLGWHKNIWDRIFDENYCVIHFEFPYANNIKSYEELKEAILKKINLIDGKCKIITSSYGTSIFLSMLADIHVKIESIVIIDGIEDSFPDIKEIKNICDNRVYVFKDIITFLNQYLDENEMKQPYLIEVVKSLVKINDEFNIEHYLDNNTLFQYLEFLVGDDIHNKISNNFANLDIPTILFTTNNIKINRSNIQIIKIDEDDHLLMLTKPSMLKKYIIS